MPDIPLYSAGGEHVGSLALPDSVFAAPVNEGLVHQAVVAEEANRRQGTAATRTRGEVRGGGRKPYRQKGTGRARQGSTRAPHWRHGGVVFGPHPRSYAKSLPVKMRRGALRAALSSRVADGHVIGLEQVQVEVPRTREVVEMLDKLPLKREINTKHYERKDDEVVRVESTREAPQRVLLIVPEYDQTLLKSCRNIPYVTLRYAPSFSVRDVVVAGRIVLAQGAVSKIEEVLAK